MNCNPPGQPKQKDTAQTQLALNALLVAADTLSKDGRFVECELRLTEAQALAQRQFGPHSEQAVLVLSITAALYRRMGKAEDASHIERRIEGWAPDSSPFDPSPSPPPPPVRPQGPLSAKLGPSNNTPTENMAKFKPLPQNVRRACQILGLSPEATLTPTVIQIAWKKQLLQQGAHPDLGGNTDEAVILNKAKEELMSYLDFVTPRARSNWKVTGQNPT